MVGKKAEIGILEKEKRVFTELTYLTRMGAVGAPPILVHDWTSPVLRCRPKLCKMMDLTRRMVFSLPALGGSPGPYTFRVLKMSE